MFIIIEMQTSKGQTTICPIITKTDLNEAYQAYYQILSAAAVSNVEQHTALILTETGNVVRCESFDHREVEEVE